MATSAAAFSFFLHKFASLGLGYAVAVSICFLLLLSTLLLASYVCCLASRRRSPTSNTVTLPRVIFVAENYLSGSSEDDESPATLGLDEATISAYPAFVYTHDMNSGDGDNVCCVCLGEYREGDKLREMPECQHCFHLQCIDRWLRCNASCPVCRSTPLQTPLSTPLSEVVPLSQFPGGHRTN